MSADPVPYLARAPGAPSLRLQRARLRLTIDMVAALCQNVGTPPAVRARLDQALALLVEAQALLEEREAC